MPHRSGAMVRATPLLTAGLLVGALLFGAAASCAQTPLLQIAQIQGAAHASPLAGQVVETEGVVTVKRATSFWIQDPSPDADPATSEALLVFGSTAASAVSVGDLIRIRGTVTEFRPGGSGGGNNLTTTELTAPTVVAIQSSGNPLPPATVIGSAGRMPPTTVIENDAGGSVETGGIFDPADDGIDFYESLEGMLIQVDNAVAVGPTSAFGEIPLLPDNGTGASVRTPRGGIIVRPTDFNPERVLTDDLLASAPAVKVGDRFTAPVIGVLDYSFGMFKLNVTTALTPVDGGLTREVAAAPTAHEIAVATYNVENLSAAGAGGNPTPQAVFDRHADIIVRHLRAPDLVAIEEIQDDSGVTDDGVVGAAATWTRLIQAIQAAGGPRYQYRQIDPLNNADGGAPGANIRVGFLFRTDRGLAFVDRPGGDATTPVQVVNTPAGPRLSVSPGRVDPQNPAWSTPEGVRKPLAGEFRARGKKLFVIANHWKSKSGDQPLFGRFQPPSLVTEAQRIAEAQVVRDFVDEILAADPQASIIVLGDLNDFEFSAPLIVLKGTSGAPTELHALIETLAPGERYTYVFEGNSQSLDHIVLSHNLFAHFDFAYHVVHVNSEFPDQASDHEPQVVRLDLRGRPTPKP